LLSRLDAWINRLLGFGSPNINVFKDQEVVDCDQQEVGVSLKAQELASLFL